MDKTYTLRTLKADDTFLMLKLIKKIGIKEIKNCFESPDVKEAIAIGVNGDGEINFAAVGMTVALEIASLVVSNLADCREELYQLLSALSGLKREEIAEMPMVDFAGMIMDVVKKEEFRDFFQAVFKSSK